MLKQNDNAPLLMHYFMVQKIISIYRASIDIFFITVLKNIETKKQIKMEEYSCPNASELWDRVQSVTTRSVLRERGTLPPFHMKM